MAGTTSNKRPAQTPRSNEPQAVARTRSLLKATDAKREFDPAAGYLDLIGEHGEPVTPATIAMQLPLVSAIYERYWRPGLTRIAKGLRGPTMGDEYASAHELMHLERGAVVLDLACGPGNFSRRFARAVGQDGLVVGYDGSRPMLDRAVSEGDPAAPLAYVLGEATKLPFKANSFDGVCCFAALNMFPEPYETLREVARVLKPGGRLALLTSNVSRGGAGALAANAFGFASGMTMFREDELARELERIGFAIERHEASGVTQLIGAVLG